MHLVLGEAACAEDAQTEAEGERQPGRARVKKKEVRGE